MQSDYAIRGFHHITLVASSAQRTARFYVERLGMQFVKKTVNFDRPDTYHLYFGEQNGKPGTLVTFFEWPDAAPGHPGIGTTHHLALSVDTYDALLKWKTWLQHQHMLVAGPFDHRMYRSIIFTDPDGVILEIATRNLDWKGASNAPDTLLPHNSELAVKTWPQPVTEISPDMGFGGLHHIAAISSDIERTDAFYQELLCMPCLVKSIDQDEPSRARWLWDAGSPGENVPESILMYLTLGEDPVRGAIGHGMTHHFALAVSSDEAQQYWREQLLRSGLDVTPILDRKYFRSIYFNDPDGHIIEIATFEPGFLVDQPADRLGKDLMLPPWLEPNRAEIEPALQALTVGA